MWIEERTNGKFRFSERYTDYLTGKIKRVSVTLKKHIADQKNSAKNFGIKNPTGYGCSSRLPVHLKRIS